MPADIVAKVVTGLARGPAAGTLVHALEWLAPWRRGTLAILTYHRVDEPSARPDLLPGLISATPSAFAAQVDDLARHYAPVSLAQVLDALDEPRRLPARAVLVTFDDAYADFAEHAWPVLRAAAVPATMFVPTAFPGQARGFWWDRLWHALATTTRAEVPGSASGTLPLRTPRERTNAMAVLRDRFKGRPHVVAMSEFDDLIAALSGSADVAPGPARDAVLGWDSLRRLAAEGLTLAPHTRHHPLLDQVPLETAVAEIVEARQDLEREVGPTPAVLAYPSGAHGGDAVEAARRAGMVLAVTTERGGNDLRSADRLRLRRINVGRRTRSPLVRTQLIWASVLDARQR